VNIKECVVIVTGASAGIGRATVETLATRGANIALTARRGERLNKLVEELDRFPGRRVAVPGDIQDAPFACSLVEQTINEFGRVDVLINNAGLGHYSPLAEIDPKDMQTVLNTNVLGLLYTTRAAVSQMKKQGHGQIINVSSIVGQRPLPLTGLYCASKTAVNFISRSLRMELRPYNITVTTIYPGRTITEFGDARLGKKGANPIPFARVSADRVANAIVKTIQHDRTEAYITWYNWLFTHLNRLFPRSIDWILARVVKVT